MYNLKAHFEAALCTHRKRTATYEIREDFPLLRSVKSVNAYRIVATFQSIPAIERLKVAMAFLTPIHDAIEGRPEQIIKRAFHLRMSKRTIEELEFMAMGPTPLDLSLEEDQYRELRGDDILSALIQQTEKPVARVVLRKAFLTRFGQACQLEIVPSRRANEVYEMTEAVARWTLLTRLEFGGKPLNQFDCSFRLKHDQLEGRVRISLGGLLGFGDLRWNDIRRETLDDDAQKAVQSWGATRRILMEIIKHTDSTCTREI
jgi:hypothetical protein